MRTRLRFVAILAGVGLLAIACGGDDDDASDAAPATSDSASSGADDGATDDDGADEVANDDGAATDGGEADGGDSPSDQTDGSVDLGDFPIPAPQGGTLVFDQMSDVRVVSYPLSELDNIVAFYGDWIAAGDWSSPEGAESSVIFSEDLGQIVGTAWPSEAQRYTITGTPDGDRIEIALSVEG